MLLKIGVGCSAGVVLVVQWWAIWGDWVCGRALKRYEKGDRSTSGKEQRRMDVELGNGDEREKERHGLNVVGYCDKGLKY
jgi:hypothetical protein